MKVNPYFGPDWFSRVAELHVEYWFFLDTLFAKFVFPELLLAMVGEHVERVSHVLFNIILFPDATIISTDHAPVEKGDAGSARDKHDIQHTKVDSRSFCTKDFKFQSLMVYAEQILLVVKHL